MDKSARVGPSPLHKGQHQGFSILADGGLPSSLTKARLKASSQAHFTTAKRFCLEQLLLYEFWIEDTQASLGAQRVKRLPTIWETQVRSLAWEEPLEKEMASHSSTLAWKMPWTEKPGRL